MDRYGGRGLSKENLLLSTYTERKKVAKSNQKTLELMI